MDRRITSIKTAEEWIDELATFEHNLTCICDQCKNGYERFITPKNIKQIQLDAFKAGMMLAAETVAHNDYCHLKIRNVCNNLTKIPE